MAKWTPCGNEFIEADVVRWKDGHWVTRSRRKNTRVKVGDRMVTAEVLREDGDEWVLLLVRACVVLSEKPGRYKVAVLPKGEEIRRKRTTLARGKAERMLWSDETARGALFSQFLGKR